MEKKKFIDTIPQFELNTWYIGNGCFNGCVTCKDLSEAKEFLKDLSTEFPDDVIAIYQLVDVFSIGNFDINDFDDDVLPPEAHYSGDTIWNIVKIPNSDIK